MTPVLPYLPEIYDDELFYSFLARYRRDLRLPQIRACRDLLGKTRSVHPLGVQSGLAYTAGRIHPERGLTIERLIADTTTYSYYSAFLKNDLRQRAFERMSSKDGKSAICVLGERSSLIDPPRSLQLCVDCCAESQERYNDLYWRRCHQLPGVLVCPIHGSILLKSPIPTLGKFANSHSIALSDTILRKSTVAADNINPEAYQLLLNISEKSLHLCSNNYEYDQDVQRATYNDKLREFGLATSNKVYTTEISVLISDYLSPISDIIPGLCPPEDIRKRSHTLWLKHKSSFHPLRHVIMQIFLEEVAKTAENIAPNVDNFGEAPWECVNSICDHFGDPCIDYAIFPDGLRGSPSKASFRCPYCGHVYRRSSGSKNIEVASFGHLFDRKLLDLAESGLPPRQIERKLRLSRERFESEAKRLELSAFAPRTNASCPKVSLTEAKRRWKELRKLNPEASRTELARLGRRLFKRLREEAPGWLARQMPRRRQGGPLRDWDRIDRDLTQKIVQRADRRRSDTPPIRVSRTYLLPNYHIETYKHKLPLCYKLIKDLEETTEDFHNRRLDWAATEIRSRGLNFTASNLIKVSKLSRMVLPTAIDLVSKEFQ